MATTGAVAPSSVTTAAESPWDDADWVSASSVTADDGTAATVTNVPQNESTTVLKAAGFDFSAIPDGATIDGVTVVLNMWRNIGVNFSLNLVQLLDVSLAKVGTNQASSPTTVNTTSTSNTYSFGGSSDVWGNALTSAWVKNANFGVGVGAEMLLSGGNQLNFDFVSIEVNYTPNLSAPGMLFARERT